MTVQTHFGIHHLEFWTWNIYITFLSSKTADLTEIWLRLLVQIDSNSSPSVNLGIPFHSQLPLILQNPSYFPNHDMVPWWNLNAHGVVTYDVPCGMGLLQQSYIADGRNGCRSAVKNWRRSVDLFGNVPDMRTLSWIFSMDVAGMLWLLYTSVPFTERNTGNPMDDRKSFMPMILKLKTWIRSKQQEENWFGVQCQRNFHDTKFEVLTLIAVFGQ